MRAGAAQRQRSKRQRRQRELRGSLASSLVRPLHRCKACNAACTLASQEYSIKAAVLSLFTSPEPRPCGGSASPERRRRTAGGSSKLTAHGGTIKLNKQGTSSGCSAAGSRAARGSLAGAGAGAGNAPAPAARPCAAPSSHAWAAWAPPLGSRGFREHPCETCLLFIIARWPRGTDAPRRRCRGVPGRRRGGCATAAPP